MKDKLLMLALAVIITIPMVAGCGRAAANPGPLPRVVPHTLDFKFENCNACHAEDQLAVTNIPHQSFSNDMCTQDGCHGALTYTTPNMTAVSRPIPHVVTAPLDNCIACHDPAKTGKVIPHSIYKDNSLCLTPACHSTTAPPPTTTTPPPTTATTSKPPTSTATTTTTSPPPSSTTSAPPPSSTQAATLPATAIDITNHNAAVLAAYKTVCLICHGPGMVNQFPLPPSWDGTRYGSTHNTVVYPVTAGSPQDHTGRTVDQCTQAGCHKPPSPPSS